MARNTDKRRVSYLAPARELMAFDLGPERVDVRGWQVFSSDARRVGVVDRLMIEQASRRVRYVAVALEADAADGAGVTPDGSVLVPVGTVRRYDRQHAIVVDGLNCGRLASAPRLHARPVTRADEIETLDAYGLPPSPEAQGDGFYTGPLFDESRLRVSDPRS